MSDPSGPDDLEIRRVAVVLQKRDTDNISWKIAVERRLKEVPVQILEAAKARLERTVDEVDDLYHRAKGDEKENDKDPAEQAEDLARHAKDVMKVGAAAFEHVAEEAQRRNDTDGMNKAREAAEHFKQGAEQLETGEQLIAKANKAAKVLRQLEEMKKACEQVRDADFSDPNQQKRGAKALDEMFGGAGELASELLPDGPWSGYFTFLQGFKQYNFIGHWTDFVHDYTERRLHMADTD